MAPCNILLSRVPASFLPPSFQISFMQWQKYPNFIWHWHKCEYIQRIFFICFSQFGFNNHVFDIRTITWTNGLRTNQINTNTLASTIDICHFFLNGFDCFQAAAAFQHFVQTLRFLMSFLFWSFSLNIFAMNVHKKGIRSRSLVI